MKIKTILDNFIAKAFPKLEIDPGLDNVKGFIKVALISLIEFAFIVTFFVIDNDNGDDFLMNAISSGSLSGEPSEFLMFINIILGEFLKLLYTIIPGLNWYWFVLLSSLFVGYTIIQYSFYRLKTEPVVRMTRHFFIFAVLFESIVLTSFTRIAGIVAIAGFMLILLNTKKSYKEYVFGLLLIVFASLIRHHVFRMHFMLGIPFFMVLLYKRKYLKLVFVGVAFLIAFSAYKYHQSVYKKNEEHNFHRIYLNKTAFTHIYNRPAFAQRTIPFDDLENWDKLDYTILKGPASGVYYKSKVFLENNDIFSEIAAPKPSFWELTFNKTFLVELKNVVRTFLDYIDQKYYHYFFLIVLVILFVSKRRYEFSALLLYFAFIVFAAFYLHYYWQGPLKERVLATMIMPAVMFSLYYLDQNYRTPKSPLFLESVDQNMLKIILFSIGFMALSFSVYKHKQRVTYLYNFRDRIYNQHQYLNGVDEEFYIKRTTNGLYYIYKNPIDLSNAFTMGWTKFSPFNRDKLEKYTGDRNANIYNIYNKDIVWFFDLTRYRIEINSVLNYYRQKHPYCKIKRQVIKLPKKDVLFKYTFHITKLDISPLSTLGVGMRFGEQYRISKMADQGLSLRMLSGGAGEPEVPQDMEIFEDLEIPEEIEAEDEE